MTCSVLSGHPIRWETTDLLSQGTHWGERPLTYFLRAPNQVRGHCPILSGHPIRWKRSLCFISSMSTVVRCVLSCCVILHTVLFCWNLLSWMCPWWVSHRKTATSTATCTSPTTPARTGTSMNGSASSWELVSAAKKTSWVDQEWSSVCCFVSLLLISNVAW